MKLALVILVSVVGTGFITGCQSAGQHREAVRDTEGTALTVGTVQREIRVGMSGADVIQSLGSPNVVSTDQARREVWVYDKISTETVHSSSTGGIATLIFGGGSSVGGVGGGSYRASAGAESRSQRTLTVIVKFDEDKLVRDFAYHTSRF